MGDLELHAEHYAAIGMNLFFYMGDVEGWVLVQGPWYEFFSKHYRKQRQICIPVFRLNPPGSKTLLKMQNVYFEKVRWTEKFGSRRKYVYGWRLLDGTLPEQDTSDQLSAAVSAPEED